MRLTMRQIGSAQPNGHRRGLIIRTAVGLWLATSLAGLWALARYDGTPGPASAVPDRWPADSSIELDPHVPTLLFFAHPKCPCTRASLAELERLVARTDGAARVRAVFFEPDEADAAWSRTGLWQAAEAIPGVEVLTDPGGVEARRFRAASSGHVLVFAPDGARLFSGGISAGRSHEGDNPGRDAVTALLNDGASECRSTPTYGCPILSFE